MAIKWMGVAMLCYFFIYQIKAKPSSANAYIIEYAPLAQSLSERTGIPASVILGIALLESGHGSSTNCVMLKNHFGIKGQNHLPQQGINYKSRYRSYSSDEASYGHFCNVIKRKSYYAKLKGNNNYNVWLTKINAGYYSSAGNVWLYKVKQAIEIHRLYKFDQPSLRLANSPRFNWLHS